MFLSTPTAKKLFKKAFSGSGLTVARYGGMLYIAGSGWETEMVYETVPYKLKASVVELCGRLPEEDERFLATRDGLQEEMNEGETLRFRYM